MSPGIIHKERPALDVGVSRELHDISFQNTVTLGAAAASKMEWRSLNKRGNLFVESKKIPTQCNYSSGTI
jgi:hypothetical protein